ncbi:MAG TPA: hypothetical protein VKO87_12220 [Gemmatimonadaceae bacterium]|nr:hypothetical protein [Gemmatimonadaceae bacterium]
MEPGHVPDTGHGVVLQSSWAPGLPVVQRFFGGIKYSKKHLIPLIAWRCSRCGYVELFAEIQ